MADKKKRQKKLFIRRKKEFPWRSSGWGWDPLLGLRTIRDTMSEMFAELFARRGYVSDIPWHPSIDMYEDGENLVVESSLPGVNKNELQIHATHNLLLISGEVKSEKEISDEHFFYRERPRGHFTRSIPLPYDIVPEVIRAELTEGVLKLFLPIKDRKKKPSYRVKID